MPLTAIVSGKPIVTRRASKKEYCCLPGEVRSIARSSGLSLFQNERKLSHRVAHPTPARRKVVSLNHDTKPVLSSRPEPIKRQRLTAEGKLAALTLRSKTERTRTEGDLERKQQKLKDCIQMMTEVLSSVRQQKSHKKLLELQTVDEKTFKQGQIRSGQYGRQFRAHKKQGKTVVVRRGRKNSETKQLIPAKKMESLLSNPLSDLNSQKVTISRRPTLVVSKGLRASSSRLKALERLECSSIEGSRSSSFLSDVGRAHLIQDLHLQNKNTMNQRPLQMRKRKPVGAFPSDFFYMR